MSRNGKIARLPKPARLQLNRRLEDGQQGKQLVEWLNSLPEVKDTLQSLFNGRPISEQNLSEWKQGGYQDWLQHQESCGLVQRLAEQVQDLAAEAGDQSVSDRFAALLAIELVRVGEALLKETADPAERWRRLRGLLQGLGQLRRDDHHAARLRIDQDRWHREADRLDEQKAERQTAELKRRACAPLLAALLAEVQQDLPPGTLACREDSPQDSLDPIQPGQSESNLIKPDQTSPPHPGAFSPAQSNPVAQDQPAAE
jgi:hypothetical protein